MFSDENPFAVWIGANDRNSEGIYKFVGTAKLLTLDSSQWVPGEPDPLFAADDDCLELTRMDNYMLDDWWCSGFNGILCEADPV